jgi:uncharacterized protein YxeA
MKYLIKIAVAVVTTLLIGALTIAATDHVEQSNMVLIQISQGEQVDKNTENIQSLTRTTDSIDWKLELIVSDLEKLQCAE